MCETATQLPAEHNSQCAAQAAFLQGNLLLNGGALLAGHQLLRLLPPRQRGAVKQLAELATEAVPSLIHKPHEAWGLAPFGRQKTRAARVESSRVAVPSPNGGSSRVEY